MKTALFGLVTCQLKYHVVLSCGGIGQYNCDNRSQQHVEAICGVLILSAIHVPPEKHPAENGVIAGKVLWH